VFFEASAAMILHANHLHAPLDVRLPGEQFERIDDAFRNLVARRTAEAGRVAPAV